MKKLVIALAACVMAGAVSAQITSQIVGYNTVNLYPGYNLLAVNFDGVGEGMSLTLGQLFPTTDEGGALLPGFTAGNAGTGDNIRFYDASTEGYTIYYLYKGAKTSDTKNYKWVSAVGSVVASDTPVASGSAFWYKKMATTTNAVSFAGQVANDASESHQILTGYNMFSSIYPVAWNPNDLVSPTGRLVGRWRVMPVPVIISGCMTQRPKGTPLITCTRVPKPRTPRITSGSRPLTVPLSPIRF